MPGDDDRKRSDPVFTLLAVIGWILPLAGLVWGPGQWWAYVLWLAAGTAVLAGYAASQKDDA